MLSSFVNDSSDNVQRGLLPAATVHGVSARPYTCVERLQTGVVTW